MDQQEKLGPAQVLFREIREKLPAGIEAKSYLQHWMVRKCYRKSHCSQRH